MKKGRKAGRPMSASAQTRTKPIPVGAAGAGNVTLRTLAAHLGFSVTTVSRALKRGPEVHKDTIERVEAAALALGYRPHLAGINLRTGRTHAVGLFLPLERPGEINNLASSLIEGVSASLTAVDYRVTVVPVTQSEHSLDAVKELVRARSVDGVILKNTKPQDERVKFLLESSLPFVAFGRTELLSKHAFFDIDHQAVGARAAKLLFDAGHDAPLIIAPPHDLTYSRLLVRGWREAHAERGRPFYESNVIFSAVTPNSGLEIARDIFTRGTFATAAFIASEEAALGFVAGAIRGGVRIGPDFGIVTFGGSQLHQFVNPPLSAFKYSHFETGKRLAHLLMRAIAGEDLSVLGEIVEACFVDNQSHLTRRR
jgi:LacI family transcriptional regulator